MGSFWPLLLIPFVVDIYWTCYIPWTWWRNIENGFLREVMSWVDAIVFATLAVWVLQNFFFQNFQIPTTSLEKTMLAGDYLCVAKYEYGPRKPITPLSLPVFQHTIDVFGMNFGKSYTDIIQCDYERMPGLRDVKRGDIVVFNYPLDDDSRPVDRRENYVKRCIGLPGETLQIIDRQVYIDGAAIVNPEQMQSRYYVYTNGPAISTAFWKSLGVYTRGNNEQLGRDIDELQVAPAASFFGIEPDSITGQYNHLYTVIMTAEKAAVVANRKDVAWVCLEPLELESYAGVFPNDPAFRWKANSFGPLWIPKAGAQVELSPENVALYGRCIRTYEGNTLTQNAQGQYILNGEVASNYTFKMNYYWMMGDNRDNSLDSRYWGFVPEDHIVGTPIFIWMSIDQETGEFRWDRFFKGVTGIK
ncbi:MAG: signal peptidase I [Bacteroidales bacterium]|nr:signal peptidase I [Bacteroidales bacterium]